MRLPYQVLVLPYKITKSSITYCVFHTRVGFWQFVSGGGEEDETIDDTAVREMFEETRIKVRAKLERLECTCSIPTSVFNVNTTRNWGNTFVIPEYTFAVDISESQIFLSDEHLEYVDVCYEKAIQLLKYDSNKTALYELNQKLALRRI